MTGVVMNRRNITNFLTDLLIADRLSDRKYYAREVTLDYGTLHPKRIDVMKFSPAGVIYASDIEKGVFTCYEIKSCNFVIRAGTLEKYTGAATNVVIPDSVTSIGLEAFSDCTGLTSVTIPDSVIKIGDKAFFSCISLVSVTIPNSVTEIGKSAFNGCTGLTNMIISGSVTKIGDKAFCGCKGLTSVTIPDNVTEIGEFSFDDCVNLVEITILALDFTVFDRMA